MQIFYTCPKCGGDLRSMILTSNPPIEVKRCDNCGWEHQEQQRITIVRTPYNPEVTDVVNHACQFCPNNKPGRVCNCVLGMPQVTC